MTTSIQRLRADFFAPFVAMCDRLQCQPTDLLAVATNESGLDPAAHNANGNASGLWQLMPSTAKGLGWNTDVDPKLAIFRALPACAQLPWWEKYFHSYRGKLVSIGACYTATFLPALVGHAGDPNYVLCALGGQLSWAYKANPGFDTTHKGAITVQDLTDAAIRGTHRLGSQWDDVVAAIKTALPPEPPLPDAA